MEDAVDERALQAGDQPGPQDRVGVEPGVVHRLDVVEREAPHPLHHQHPAGDPVRVRAGHDHRALARDREDAGEVEHVLGLEPEVELLHDLLGEQLHERRRVGQRGDGDAAHEERAEPGEGPQVGPYERGHLGPLHLHDHFLARDQAGGVHLRDRRRGDGLFVELGEDRVEWAAELGFDHRADLGKRCRGHLVAQLLELVDQLVGEEALEGRDDLAQLHIRGAEPFELTAEAPRDAGA